MVLSLNWSPLTSLLTPHPSFYLGHCPLDHVPSITPPSPQPQPPQCPQEALSKIKGALVSLLKSCEEEMNFFPLFCDLNSLAQVKRQYWGSQRLTGHAQASWFSGTSQWKLEHVPYKYTPFPPGPSSLPLPPEITPPSPVTHFPLTAHISSPPVVFPKTPSTSGPQIISSPHPTP